MFSGFNNPTCHSITENDLKLRLQTLSCFLHMLRDVINTNYDFDAKSLNRVGSFMHGIKGQKIIEIIFRNSMNSPTKIWDKEMEKEELEEEEDEEEEEEEDLRIPVSSDKEINLFSTR